MLRRTNFHANTNEINIEIHRQFCAVVRLNVKFAFFFLFRTKKYRQNYDWCENSWQVYFCWNQARSGGLPWICKNFFCKNFFGKIWIPRRFLKKKFWILKNLDRKLVSKHQDVLDSDCIARINWFEARINLIYRNSHTYGFLVKQKIDFKLKTHIK